MPLIVDLIVHFMQGAKFDVKYVVNGSEYAWYYLLNDKYIHVSPYLCKLFMSLKGEKGSL
jgi:hypothetical protein